MIDLVYSWFHSGNLRSRSLELQPGNGIRERPCGLELYSTFLLRYSIVSSRCNYDGHQTAFQPDWAHSASGVRRRWGPEHLHISKFAIAIETMRFTNGSLDWCKSSQSLVLERLLTAIPAWLVNLHARPPQPPPAARTDEARHGRVITRTVEGCWEPEESLRLLGRSLSFKILTGKIEGVSDYRPIAVLLVF